AGSRPACWPATRPRRGCWRRTDSYSKAPRARSCARPAATTTCAASRACGATPRSRRGFPDGCAAGTMGACRGGQRSMGNTAGAPRMENLDALRGFALFGLFMVHMPELFELYWLVPATDPFQLKVHNAVWLLLAGKAFALMALCFGVSFFIMMDSAARRGGDFSLRFAWRLLLLGAMGLLHGLWY